MCCGCRPDDLRHSRWLHHGLGSARSARDHLRDGLRWCRVRRGGVWTRAARCFVAEHRSGAGDRARPGLLAVQRLCPHRPALASARAGLAVPAAADRASADDGVRSRRRRPAVPGHGRGERVPPVNDALLDRCCPGPARRRRHGGARAGAPGPGRGERPERRTGRPVLPGGHGHHNGNLGEGRSSRGPQQCRGTDRLGCAGRNGRGAVGGFVFRQSDRRGWLPDQWRQVFTFAVALAAYALSGELGGSGFIAAFVAGLASVPSRTSTGCGSPTSPSRRGACWRRSPGWASARWRSAPPGPT